MIRLALGLMILVLVVSLPTVSCYAPGSSSTLKVENRRAIAVTLFQNSERDKVIEPHTKEEYAIYKFEGQTTYSLRDQNGDIIASETFTFQDMLGRDGITLVTD